MAARGSSEVAQHLSHLSLDPVRQPAESPDAAIAGTAPAVEALREIIGDRHSQALSQHALRCASPPSLAFGLEVCTAMSVQAAEHQRAWSMGAGWPQLYAEQGRELGVTWPRGLLLHGPPGTGKTLAVRVRPCSEACDAVQLHSLCPARVVRSNAMSGMQAVAAEFGATLHIVTASSVFGAYTGESERRLREAFEKASEPAEGATGQDGRGSSTPAPPAVLFLDELDALCPRRDAKRPHESRVVAQLLTLLDGSSSAGGGPVPLAAFSTCRQACH